jgi:GNAT superfamily N-acetyltransferase
MPLSPTDFYAYSRATGAPVAETPEERARQAPDVYAFRQSQLQAPQQADQGGFNVLDALGKTALAAGALAGGLGLYGRFRGKGLGKAVENAAESQAAARSAQVAKTTAQARQPVQRVANIRVDSPNNVLASPEYAALFNEKGFPIDLKLAGPTASPQRAVSASPPASKQTSALPLANEFLYSQIGKILGDAPNEDIVAISKLRPFSQSQLTASSGLDAGDRFIEEYAPEYEKLVRGQARQDADVARRVRAHQMQVQGKAERILADLKQEALAESKPTFVEAKPNLGVQLIDLPTVEETQPLVTATEERMVRRHGRMVPLSSVSNQTRPALRSSQSFLTEAVQPSEEVLDRLAADYESRSATNLAGQNAGETMVDQHNTQALQHSYQSVSAVNSSEDQMTGRMKHALQQNPDLDMSQIEVLEDIAEYNYQQGMEQPSPYPAFDTSENYPSDSAINIAATQATGRVPNDQAEGNTASSAQRFLTRERMEIASQLGEQNLPVSPGRIEAELNRRLGSQASEYGPYYTRRKQALQMGATYGGKFFENVNEQNVNVAGVNFPASSSDFRQAVLNEDTATRAEDYFTQRRNQQKDWLGNIRLKAEPKINQILVERQDIARETAGKLKEQQAALLAAGDTQGAAYAERQIQNMREIWKDPFLGQHREDEIKKLSAQVNRASGKAYGNMEDIQKRFPTALASDVDENKRIFFQTSSPKGTKVDMSMLDPTWEDINEPVEDVVLSMGDINPYTVELRSGRRPTVENVGAYGENLEPQKMQAASGTAIRGVSGIPFITESSAEPMSASAAEQSRKAAYVASLQPVEKTLEETQKQSAQKFVDKYKGGIGLYGEVLEDYPEGALTPEGEYTELAKQQPSLVYNKYGDVDQAANAPSIWSKYSDEALGEMSLMGINPRMRHMAEKTLMQRQSVRASEDVRLGKLQPTLEADAAKTGGKRLANALIDHKQRTGKVLSPQNAVDFASSIAQQEGTDVNSVLNAANKYSQSIGKTSDWTLISKADADETNFTRKYGQYLDSPTAPEQANLQQTAARVMASSVPNTQPVQQANVSRIGAQQFSPAMNKQLTLPGLTSYELRNTIKQSPADIAAQQLNDYMVKARQREPLAARPGRAVLPPFQPKLF